MELKDEMSVKEKCYYLELHSSDLPFVCDTKKFSDLDKANDNLQKFVRILEKKFDGIWYIGTDYLDDELYERFMFHHGGFMEISLNGKIRVFFMEDKIEKFIEALESVITSLASRSRAENVIARVKSGQRLISLKESLQY